MYKKMEIILYKCYLQFIKNLNIAPNSGYVLSELIVDGNAVTVSDTYTFTNVTGNHTITATFDILQTYTVSYNGNGGTNVPTSQTKTHGVDLTITSEIPSRQNYEFVGWGTSSNSTTIAYASGSIYTADADLTLYAIWKAELVDIASLGEYVEYIPNSTSYQTDTATTGHTESQTFNPSTTTLWRIISNDGTNIKLISSDVINDTSSAGLSLKGNTGYTNAVTTLTNLAGAYVNTDYAASGSYPTAITEITTAGVGLTTEYWLAATSGTSAITGYNVSYVNASGAVANALLYKKIISTTENTVAYAVRPEVTLKPNIVFIGGDGTIDNPYKLSATEIVNKHTITVTQSSGGTISPDTTKVVNGSSKTFTITADEECAISKLIVDNVEQTITDNKVMAYAFNNVTENHTITAEYITLITKPTVAFVSKTTNSFTVTAVFAPL